MRPICVVAVSLASGVAMAMLLAGLSRERQRPRAQKSTGKAA